MHCGVREVLLEQYRRYKTPDAVFCRNFSKSLDSCVSTPGLKTNEKWIEPPCVFVGRDSKHPLRGSCKPGVRPCDVVVNTAVTRALKRDGFVRFEYHPEKRWKYAWRDTLFREKRYIYTKTNSDDIGKFDLARKLRKKLPILKKKFDPLLWYFMDTLCIRVGNEKNLSVEADTVGCCTLRAHDHVRVLKNLNVHILFPGKDSVMFEKKIKLPPTLHQDLVTRLSQRQKGQRLFDTASPTSINRTIHKVMPNCSAKQFRTMRASVLFEKTLFESNDPLLANTKVAELLNHRRKDTSLLLETSRNNYIDPRVFFAYQQTHPTNNKGLYLNWFKDAKWAKETNQADFKF